MISCRNLDLWCSAYAAELARVSVWIGEIQWMRRNGFPGSRQPILDPLETIECCDAILTPEGGEPEWPEADAIIGNPPFLGGKRLIANLGEEYVSTICRRPEFPSGQVGTGRTQEVFPHAGAVRPSGPSSHPTLMSYRFRNVLP